MLGLVLGESVVMGLAGVALGTVLAIVGGWFAASGLEARTGVRIEPALDPTSIVVVAALTVVLSAVAGLGPALRAYRTAVAEHLRPLG